MRFKILFKLYYTYYFKMNFNFSFHHICIINLILKRFYIFSFPNQVYDYSIRFAYAIILYSGKSRVPVYHSELLYLITLPCLKIMYLIPI